MKNFMKKITAVLVLTILLCFTAFADGDMPTGNKNCQGQTSCLAAPGNDDDPVDQNTTKTDIVKAVQAWLSKLFG